MTLDRTHNETIIPHYIVQAEMDGMRSIVNLNLWIIELQKFPHLDLQYHTTSKYHKLCCLVSTEVVKAQC